MINLNDTTPAAPSGKANVKWQADSSNPENISAYMPPATATLPGAVPTPPNDATKYLDGTMNFTTPAGGGGGSAATVNDQTASYTAVIGDANNIVTMNNGSANNFTIPPNSSVAFPIGTVIVVIQKGAGQTTLVAGGGVTLNNPSSDTTRAQWSTVSVTKILTDTWVAAGDLT